MARLPLLLMAACSFGLVAGVALGQDRNMIKEQAIRVGREYLAEGTAAGKAALLDRLRSYKGAIPPVIDELRPGKAPAPRSKGLTGKVSFATPGLAEAYAEDHLYYHFNLETRNVRILSLWFHPEMADLTKPIQLTVNGNPQSIEAKPSLAAALRSFGRRHDWGLIYHACAVVEIPAE